MLHNFVDKSVLLSAFTAGDAKRHQVSGLTNWGPFRKDRDVAAARTMRRSFSTVQRHNRRETPMTQMWASCDFRRWRRKRRRNAASSRKGWDCEEKLKKDDGEDALIGRGRRIEKVN